MTANARPVDRLPKASRARPVALGALVVAIALGAVVLFRLQLDPAFWSGPQLAGNWDVIAFYFVQHLRYALSALALGVMAAMPIAYLAVRRPATYPVLLSLTNIIYAVPSLAMFIVLGAWLGYLNDRPVVVAMALYTLVILVRNIVEAVRSVPDPVVTAADAMGYRPLTRYIAVDLPLSLPGIVAGLRLATVSTVSLISVGALVGRGGLGRLFDDGRNRAIAVEIWSGIVAIVVLALALDALIVFAGWLATPWVPRRSRRRAGAGIAAGAGLAPEAAAP